MRKSFTLLFAALLACVGVAKADPVAELQDKTVKVGAAATSVTADQWYILNNVGRGAYVSQEDNNLKMRAANSVVDDDIATEKANYLFKITAAADGKYNIMSGNGKYFALGSNTASVSDEAVNFEIGLIGKSTDNFYLFDADHNYAADGQEIGNAFVGWSTSIPTSAGGNDSYRLLPVSFETVSLVSVTYTFKCGDEVVTTQKTTLEAGNAYPEFEYPFGYAATTAKPEGTVEADAAVEVELVVSLPFEAADDVDDITTWYYAKMHSNFPKYIQALDDNTIEWEDGEMTEGEEESYLWGFAGNIKDGFKVVNKGGKAIVSTSGAATLGDAANATAFVLSASNQNVGFCLKYPNSDYLNAQDGYVKSYNSNDAGSTFSLEEYVAPEVEQLAITLPEGLEWVELIEFGQTIQLGAVLYPLGASSDITWTSSNEDIISINENGLAEVVGYTGYEPVCVYITATAANGVNASIEAYVMAVNNNGGDAAAYDVKLNTTWGQLYAIGETLQLTATAFVRETETVVDPNTGENIDKVIEVPVEEEVEFYWESSAWQVYVSETGLVQVLTAYEGSVTITAKAPNGKSAQCKIYVFAAEEGGELNDIYLNIYYISEDDALKVGETFQLVVTFDPVEAAEELVWESSDEKVLTVDENGLVTAVGAGDATIYVTTVSDYGRGWFEKTCTIYVVEGEGETGINAVEADAETVIYDLTGRRVEKMQKGIYIVNGKKVLVK